MTLNRTQEQIEKELSDILPHGIREGIAKGTGIYPKIVDAYFNANDERKSPHFIVLHIQSVLDALDPATGEMLWRRLTELREESMPAEIASRRTESPDRELGQLTKEVSDVVVAKCEGRPITEQLREIAEAERQLARYKDSILATLGRSASDASEAVN